jgi:hypothetical protein
LRFRESRPLHLQIACTEHRKNWFELPEVFRFAEERNLYLHINCCVWPPEISLYTLPTDALRLVHDFLLDERGRLLASYPTLRNLPTYDYLLRLIADELDGRTPEWSPPARAPASTLQNPMNDGKTGAPRPGVPPFHTPERVMQVLGCIAKLKPPTAEELLREMAAWAESRLHDAQWRPVRESIQAHLQHCCQTR